MSDTTNDATQRNRGHLGTYVYERYCQGIGQEVGKWSADIAEAVNDSVTEKKIVIGANPAKVNERYHVTVGKTIEVLIQADKITGDYPYSNDTTVTAVVEKSL